MLRTLSIALSVVWMLAGCRREESAGKGFASVADLNDARCTIAGEVGSFADREARAKLPKARFEEHKFFHNMLAALKSGRVDAIAYDRPGLDYAASERPEFVLLPDNVGTGHIAVAARLGREDLVARVNAFIAAYRADGTYGDMYRRWVLGHETAMPDLPEAARPDGTLVVGTDITYPPMNFGTFEQPVGFDVEFARRLAFALNKRLELKVLDFEAQLIAVRTGAIDLSVCQMDATPERCESTLFSDPYIDSAASILVNRKDAAASVADRRRTFADLKGRRIGCLTGSVFDQLARRHIAEPVICPFSQVNHQIIALANRKIDGFVLDTPQADLLLQERPDFAELDQRIPVENYAYAFSKGNAALADAVSEEIDRLRADGTLEKLRKKWCTLHAEREPMAQPIASDRVLRLATVPELPPFTYMYNGRIVGYEVELAICVANRLGYRLEYVPCTVDSIIENILAGRADMAASGIIATPERAESVRFSRETMRGSCSVVVRRPSAGAAPDSSGIVAAWCELRDSFEKTFLRERRGMMILSGLGTTVYITLLAVLWGTALAFAVCFLCRSRNGFLARIGQGYVMLLQGSPILVVLMILYYVVFVRTGLSASSVAIIAFALDLSAYVSVALRSGIDAVPAGQREAALALGFTPVRAFLEVTMPQVVRMVLPVYRGLVISTLKATAIVGYISIQDLTKASDIIRSRTYEAFFPLIATAAIYFLAAKGLTLSLEVLERRLAPGARRDRLVARLGKRKTSERSGQ